MISAPALSTNNEHNALHAQPANNCNGFTLTTCKTKFNISFGNKTEAKEAPSDIIMRLILDDLDSAELQS